MTTIYPKSVQMRRVRRRVIRRQSVEYGKLGDGLGRTWQGAGNGMYWVRFQRGQDSAGNPIFSKPEAVYYKAGVPIIDKDGVGVEVGSDRNENRIIIGMDDVDLRASGNVNPVAANPLAPQFKFTSLNNITNFHCYPVGNIDNPSTLVTIYPLRYVNPNNELHYYTGTTTPSIMIDLAPYIPPTDYHCYAVLVFDVFNETVSIKTTPDIALATDLTENDLQSIFDDVKDFEIPIQAFHLANGQTSITTADMWEDLRQFINMPPTWGYENPVIRDRTLLSGKAMLVASTLTVDPGATLTIEPSATLTIMGTESAIWNDAGSYIYPVNGEALGNPTIGGSNKIAGANLSSTLAIEVPSATLEGITIKSTDNSTTKNVWEVRDSVNAVLSSLSGGGGGLPGGTLTLSNTATDATAKTASINVKSYANTNGLVTAFYSATTAAANYVYFGGGYTDRKAAQYIYFYTSGAVTTAVGTSKMEINPSGTVTINGFAAAANGLVLKAASAQSANIAQITDNSNNALVFVTANGGLTVNEQGNDADTRIEGDTATNLFVCDAGLEAVQVGTTVAGTILDCRVTEVVVNDAGGATPDFRIEGDTEDKLFLSDARNDQIRIGDGDTNYTNWDKTGHQTMVGNAQPWDDFPVPLIARTTGVRAPVFEQWHDNGSGSIGVFRYSFDDAIAASEKELYFDIQMPHTWNQGAFTLHVHWEGNVADTNATPYWGCEYVFKSPGQTYGNSTIIYSLGHHVGDQNQTLLSTIDAYKHYISPFSPITPDSTNNSLSAILSGRLFRNSSSASDTYDATGNKCGLKGLDIHYQKARIGSDLEYTP